MFLDHCGIAWLYEEQGILVSMGRGRVELPWLPDFELPELDQLAEVKGSLTQQEAVRLMLLAGGASECGTGKDVVILGHIPQYGSARWPVQIHNHGGIWALPWDLMTGCPLERPRPRVRVGRQPDISMLLEGMLAGTPRWAEGGFDAARGARFEHGESGARR